MPELPEVETTLRGISPHIRHKKITNVVVRQTKLRYPVPENLGRLLQGKQLVDIRRRAKYLLLEFESGVLLLHLGMSGSLRIVSNQVELRKHDHVDLVFGETILRFHDPRRFGLVLWTDEDVTQHSLIKNLGPEPFDEIFTPQYLFERSRKRKIPTKQFIMENKTVVGVGNIYASESLFLSAIRPGRSASRLTKADCERLVENIRLVLGKAIEQGGTTLKDFTNSEGNPGYFAQSLNVYGRDGESCFQCGDEIKSKVIAQRNTFYCPSCQC